MASQKQKERYQPGEENKSRPYKENITDCRWEKCGPDKENVICTIVILVVGALAVVAGTYLGKETIQSIEDYNFPVHDAKGDEIAMSNFLAYKNVTAIFIPESNYIYPGTSTQTFLDFDTNLTCVIDTTNEICFILPLNRTHLASFTKVKGALVNGTKITSLQTTVSKTELTISDALYSDVMGLGSYAKNECVIKKKIFSAKPGKPPTGTNCTVTNLPYYEVRDVNGQAMLQITKFHQVESSCQTT